MNQRTRTENVSANMVAALACQVVNLLANFISQTVFIRTLGADYLGVNGLFTNVLAILSFAELGIGNAIVFSMYKPLATDDRKKLTSLMYLYRQAYWTIGIVIALLGLCVTPFLHFIIREEPNVKENLSILYLLFLTRTAISYFFVYKKSIIIADQKNYIVLLVTEGVHIVQVAVQIAVLKMTGNYILYLLIYIGCTLLENLVASRIADKMYPFLREKAEQLPRGERKSIFRNVRALAAYKFGSVILNGTDNILVSTMVGVTEVGLVSNYVLITNAAGTILGKITDAFTASIGNLNAVGRAEKQYGVFQKMFFITAWIYGYASVGLLTVFNSFIEAWIGKTYQLDMLVVGAIVAEFFVKGMHSVSYTYRTTYGYFVQGKYSALAAAAINLVLSILLCKWIGLAGIFIATPVARIFSIGIVDPVLIFRNSFHKNPIFYYLNYAKYLALFIGIGALCRWLVAQIPLRGWVGVFCDAVIITVVFNGIMLLVFAPTKMFRELVASLKGLKRLKDK